jgi:hypothetical protein
MKENWNQRLYKSQLYPKWSVKIAEFNNSELKEGPYYRGRLAFVHVIARNTNK